MAVSTPVSLLCLCGQVTGYGKYVCLLLDGLNLLEPVEFINVCLNQSFGLCVECSLNTPNTPWTLCGMHWSKIKSKYTTTEETSLNMNGNMCVNECVEQKRIKH